MALEFAIRPRIVLERPAPRRRGARLWRFASLMALYWLGIAGATLVLLRTVREDPDADAAEPAAADLTDAPAEEAAPEPALAPAVEPAPPVADSLAAETPPPTPPEPPAAIAPRPEPAVAIVARAEPPPATPERPAAMVAHPERPAATVAGSERAAAIATRPTTTTPSVARSEPPPREAPPERRREQPAAPGPSLPSCDAAAASASETLDMRAGPAAAPDLSREAFAAVLDNGAYLAACALPPRTAVEICAAVQDGKVVGVSASTEPGSPVLNACVRRAVAALRFPRSPRLDVTRTHFDAVR